MRQIMVPIRCRTGTMDHMVKNPPVSMQHSLRQRLAERVAQRWPNDLTGIEVRGLYFSDPTAWITPPTN